MTAETRSVPVSRHASLLLLAVLLPLLLAGCANVGYYFQSVSGQLDIWRRERAIEDVLRDPGTSEALKRQLDTAMRIRDFASKELGLPDNQSYRSYADLGRPFVVWNVFAAPEFSVQPVQSCFVFVGCVDYRGYFSRKDADRLAAELSAQGHDAYVGGVPAYSTLGYFPDPVLNTFIHYPEAEMARLVFHELAHQLVYIKDDSTFNESFAVAVEEEGVKRWLDRTGDERQREVFERNRRARAEFTRLIEKHRARLTQLYQSGGSPDAMREGKQAIFAEMESEYQARRPGWGGHAGYERWFASRPNNAHLASVSIYTQLVPAFQAMLAQSGGDLPDFYSKVRELARRSSGERDAALGALMPQGRGRESAAGTSAS